MDIRSYLERLFNEDAWRRKQVEQLPPANMSDMRGPSLEDRFSKLQPYMELEQKNNLKMMDLYRNIEREGKFWGFPQPMPKSLWDVWISDQIKPTKPPPLI